jgi:hypothetical protein
MLDKWAWITVLSVVLVMVVPLVLVWLILQMPGIFRLVATIAIFVVWGIVSGYKDWVVSKHKEAENEPPKALGTLPSSEVKLN